MSGGLDEALARMARWDELRQRVGNDRRPSSDPRSSTDPRHAVDPRPRTSEPAVVDEVIEAIGGIVARRGPVTVTVTVEDAGTMSTVRIIGRDAAVTVSRLEPHPAPAAAPPVPPAAPPQWPMGSTQVSDPAVARLA